MQSRLVVFLFAAASLVLVEVSESAHVTLENGDRITGQIVNVTSGGLIVKTAYGTTPLIIPAEKITNVAAPEPTRVRLSNGDVLTGRITGMSENTLRLKTGYAGTLSIALAQLAEGTAASADIPSGSQETPAAEEEKPDRWKGAFTAGGTRQSGNTERMGANVSVSATRETDVDLWRLGVSYHYAEEEGELTARKVYGSLKYEYDFKEDWYWFVSTEFLSDEFQNLNLRTVIGTGLGYRWVDTEKLSLKTEAGIGYISENFETGDDNTELTARLAGMLDWQITDTLSFSEHLIVYPSLEGGGYILRNEAALANDLGNNWSLELSNIIDYDSQPEPGVKKEDVYWSLGLRYAF